MSVVRYSVYYTGTLLDPMSTGPRNMSRAVARKILRVLNTGDSRQEVHLSGPLITRHSEPKHYLDSRYLVALDYLLELRQADIRCVGVVKPEGMTGLIFTFDLPTLDWLANS